MKFNLFSCETDTKSMHLSETEIFGEFKRILAENYFGTTNGPNKNKRRISLEKMWYFLSVTMIHFDIVYLQSRNSYYQWAKRKQTVESQIERNGIKRDPNRK